MKKLFYLIAILGISASSVVAQTTTTKTNLKKSTTKKTTVKKTTKKTTAAPKVVITQGVAITFEKADHDFGNVKEGPDVVYTFKFTNTGTEDILINSASAGCGCTVPEWPKEPIKSGQSGEIKVLFHTAGRPGGFAKDVTVTYNGNQSTVIKIHGNVVTQASDPGNGGVQIQH